MRLIVNEQLINTSRSAGTPLLTFLREDLRLHGSKSGCREGDCGACTVLVGTLDVQNNLQYHSVVSCLMPLGSCHGKHIITIEGIAQDNLNNIQSAIVEEGASQCGFCTPGIVMSLLGFLLNSEKIHRRDMLKSLDGNICRCTGYKSIERAVSKVAAKLDKDFPVSLSNLVSVGYLPAYFFKIKTRLAEIQNEEIESNQLLNSEILIGGGTDLLLQKPDDLMDANLKFLSTKESDIIIENGNCHISGATTIAALQADANLKKVFPEFQRMLSLFASTPIRNMATVAGNIANASPIGDMSILLLALDASVQISGQGSSGEIPLDQFFKSYKKTALRKGEIIAGLSFGIPSEKALFNFEKISKRRILDIASVNSAVLIERADREIKQCRISAGGVAPIPLYLQKVSEALIGPLPDAKRLSKIIEIMNEEISPISDIRGSEKYKRLILRQLLLAHLMPLVGEKNVITIMDHE